jgi:hypothetical protein
MGKPSLEVFLKGTGILNPGLDQPGINLSSANYPVPQHPASSITASSIQYPVSQHPVSGKYPVSKVYLKIWNQTC